MHRHVHRRVHSHVLACVYTCVCKCRTTSIQTIDDSRFSASNVSVCMYICVYVHVHGHAHGRVHALTCFQTWIQTCATHVPSWFETSRLEDLSLSDTSEPQTRSCQTIHFLRSSSRRVCLACAWTWSKDVLQSLYKALPVFSFNAACNIVLLG